MDLEELSPGFSTADAEDPHLRYDGVDLVATFQDWRECTVQLVFPQCYMFAWQQIPDAATCAPDRIYALTDSEWLQELDASDLTLQHYRLCFNASYYQLDVLALGMSHCILEQPGELPN